MKDAALYVWLGFIAMGFLGILGHLHKNRYPRLVDRSTDLVAMFLNVVILVLVVLVLFS